MEASILLGTFPLEWRLAVIGARREKGILGYWVLFALVVYSSQILEYARPFKVG